MASHTALLTCLPWWMKIDFRVKRRYVMAFVAVEIGPTVAALTLFGIQDPNTYRTQLWAEGNRLGYNSSPTELLYAAANYRPIDAPLPWNQLVTNYNVVISILSTFVMIVKSVMLLTHTLPPAFSALLHLAFTVLWCYSAALQTAPDYSDPNLPSPSPWYLRHSCGDPVLPNLQGYCQQSKAAFGVTIVQIVLFFSFFVFSCVMAVPSAAQKEKRREMEQEAREWEEIENFDDKQFNYELDQMHLPMQTPGSAFFPAGAGVLQPQMMQEHQQQPDNPSKGYYAASVEEVETKPPVPEKPSNKDLPLRHHFSSDVYS